MSTIYIADPGAVVRQASQHLVVTKDNERLKTIPLLKLERLVIFGHVQLTTEAMHALLKEGVDVAFLTGHGKLRGRLLAADSKNVFLRLAQYERHLDERFPVHFARSLVKAKIRNGRAIILRHQINHPEKTFAAEVKLIEETVKNLDHLQTVNSIMGAEGSATAAYFRAFGQMFRKELAFATRTRRPPKDPVNAVLSLGYSLLTNEILSLLMANGFDPYLGFLHGAVYGRPSLALDVVEEFRHPVIDRLTLNLFNNEILHPEDFRPVEGEGVYLTPEALKTYLKLYERRLQEPLDSENPANQVSFRNRLREQIQNLARTIQHLEPYKPFRIRP